MAIHIRRREFIGTVGAAMAWPFSVHAQQAARPLIGFLNCATAVQWAPFVDAFIGSPAFCSTELAAGLTQPRD